jgi:transcriptional regulator with XRE-family HTH domain
LSPTCRGKNNFIIAIFPSKTAVNKYGREVTLVFITQGRTMIVKKLRLQKCWSQEQVSEFSGLSVRTIQRIERGHQASLESLKALASVFQIAIHDLQPEHNMDAGNSQTKSILTSIEVNLEEKKAMDYVEGIKNFYHNLITYFITIGCLTAVNLFVSP